MSKKLITLFISIQMVLFTAVIPVYADDVEVAKSPEACTELLSETKRDTVKETAESRLILDSGEKPIDTNAESVIYYQPDDVYYITYENAEEAKKAKKVFERQYGQDAVMQDTVVTLSETETFDGKTYMGFDQLKKLDWGTGEVTVAVLDTGANKNHALLRDRIDEDNSKDMTGNDSEWRDTDGHGSHVAGVVTQSTPINVKILVVKVFEDKDTTLSLLNMGIQYASNQNVDVINMSVGADTDLIDDNSYKMLEDTLKEAYDKGIVLCTAAGNDGVDVEGCYPAASGYTISVGSIDKNENHSSWSNTGELLDFVAPGEGIVSASETSSYAVGEGTSMACPFIAAACAMVKLKYKDHTSDDVYAKLCDYTKDLGEAGKDIEYGNGSVVLHDFDEEVTGKHQAISLDYTSIITTTEDLLKEYDLNVKVHADQPGELSYHSSDDSVATVDNGIVTLHGAGECLITVTAQATDEYAESSRTIVIKVSKLYQTIEVSQTSYTKTLDQNSFSLSAKRISGDGVLGYISNDTSVIKISNNKAYIKGVGCTRIIPYLRETNKYDVEYGDPITVTVKPGRVNNLKALPHTYTTLTLNWTKTPVNYQVYMYKSSKYVRIGTTSSSSYKVTKLKCGKTYQFKIRGYKKYKGKYYYGAYTSIKGKVLPAAPKVKLTGKTISWSKVGGATGYAIYRKTGKTYKLYKDIKKLSCKDKSMKKGYKYKVKAYRSVKGKKIYSKYSNVVQK